MCSDNSDPIGLKLGPMSLVMIGMRPMNSLENTEIGQTPNAGSNLSISRAAPARFADKWKDTLEEQQNNQAFWQDIFYEPVRDQRSAGIWL